MMEKMQVQNQNLLFNIENELEATAEELEEIYESSSKGVTIVEEKVSSFEKTIDTKVINSQKSVEEKPDMMVEKVNNLQRQRPELVRSVSEDISRKKKPCFDSSPLSVFKLQFETVSSRNGLDDPKKAFEHLDVKRCRSRDSRKHASQLQKQLQ